MSEIMVPAEVACADSRGTTVGFTWYRSDRIERSRIKCQRGLTAARRCAFALNHDRDQSYRSESRQKHHRSALPSHDMLQNVRIKHIATLRSPSDLLNPATASSIPPTQASRPTTIALRRLRSFLAIAVPIASRDE